MKIYIVFVENCEFEGCYSDPVKAFVDKEKANKFKSKCEEELKEIKPLHDELNKKHFEEHTAIQQKYEIHKLSRDPHKNVKKHQKMLNSKEYKDMLERQQKEEDELLQRFTYDKGQMLHSDDIYYSVQELELVE